MPPRTGVQPPRAIVRRSSESWALQSALERHGLGPVVGVDEAGRGACAGPLAVAACILRPGDARRFEGLTDSKLLTKDEREEFARIIERRALDWHVVLVDPPEVDRRGVHIANIDGMRRAVARLDVRPGYVLTDGFRVSGFGVPSLAVPKGDLAAACVAAASVLAKVTRDRLMTELHEKHPEYRFDLHKGYCTPTHSAALAAHGPCEDHRFSFVNVAAAARGRSPDGYAVGVRHNGAVTVDDVSAESGEADELVVLDENGFDETELGGDLPAGLTEDVAPEGGEPR
ncbi:ribonuclease HII [Actinomycetospora straminea]|uniref:ribonuclease HII n=1 Tax=Actinomycetospora straminea TaxID=663607 RepID=UPI0023657F77|nr:ribonuclease HII [Actinomycetospora straminea]MDD7931741.1 ribonuclease HII [Actinomycetospora straminea]